MPKGRSFQALATALPSVNAGELEGGFQVNGASAGENNFTVDGVSVVSQIHGNQRQDAVFEYLQEVQVKTSGLEAEYGGALGGVISAVTKSGGNTFQRLAVRALLGSWLRSHNGCRQASADRSDHAEHGVLSFRTTIRLQPQRVRRHHRRADRQGPSLLLRIRFAAHREPHAELHASAPERSCRSTRDRTTQSMFGKVTYSPISRLQLNLSGLWTPDKADGIDRRLRRRPCRITTTFDAAGFAARQTLGYEVPQWNMAYTGDYTATDKTLISVRGGYMKDNYFDTGVNTSQTFEYATATASLPPTLLATVPVQFRQAAGYSNLPRIQIKDHDITTRNFADFSLTQMFNAAGQHQFKGGFGIFARHQRCAAGVSEQGLCHASSGTRRSRATCLAWARARAPTATTRSTTSARSGRPARTSSACSCRTTGRSRRG